MVRLVAPIVRPWNARRKPMIPGLPVVRRASLMAPSTASAPLLQRNTFGSARNGASPAIASQARM